MSKLITEFNNKFESGMDRRVENVLKENKSWKDRYKTLIPQLESNDPKKVLIAKNTLLAMENQLRAMESIRKDVKLEATFTNALGPMLPRVIDLVRIFYPNLIAQYLTDIQILDRQNGEIFYAKPVFTNTAGGVMAGQEIFRDQTDGTYSAMTTQNFILGYGDGTVVTFNLPTANQKALLRQNSIRLEAGAVRGQDDGNGMIFGNGVSGTVDYPTGAITVTFNVAPPTGTVIYLTMQVDYEANPETINQIEMKLGTTPIQAQPHPLIYVISTQAQMVASSHLDLDVSQIMTEAAASFIKYERDIKLCKSIVQSAHIDTTGILDFDATPPPNYSRLAKYAEIEAKIDYAEALIQTGQGRGGLSFILCGVNAANVFRNCAGFVSDDPVAPIGPHKIGTLRDGTVTVVKAFPGVIDPDEYVFGFKGYVVGDSASILAEWIPLYVTPTWQAYNLNNYTGLLSMYTVVTNNDKYYVKGKLLPGTYKA
jgi:hypothetical protein